MIRRSRSKRGSSILWVQRSPSPQFVRVLNEIAAQTEVLAYYRTAGDLGRGWGDLGISHDYNTIPRAKPGTRKWIRFATGFLSSGGKSHVVVLGYSYAEALGALVGARVTGKKVFTLSDSDYAQDQGRSSIRRVVKRVILRTLMSAQGRVWTVGDSNSKYWSYYGYTNQARAPFSPPLEAPTEGSARRAKNAMPESGEIRVLYVGRDIPLKRVDDLVKAIEILNVQGKRTRLYTLGPTTVARRASCVTNLGPVAHGDLAAYYDRADVVSLVSDREAYGLVVSEALQRSRPVVASVVIPAARELCNKGWNLVPVGVPREIARAVERAAEDRNEVWTYEPSTFEYFYANELLQRGGKFSGPRDSSAHV